MPVRGRSIDNGFWLYGTGSNGSVHPRNSAATQVLNVRAGACYPATMVTTSDHDDRVVPSHSYKYTAVLQEAQGCDKPVLLRV